MTRIGGYANCSLKIENKEQIIMKTKELILNTAKELISEVGFHRTTTSSLAKKANISEGTIYRHFESKEEILHQILTDFQEKYARLLDRCRRWLEGDHGTLARALKEHYDFADENQADIKTLFATYNIIDESKNTMGFMIKEMSSFMEEALTKGQAREVVKKVDVQQNALVLVTVFTGLLRIKLYWPDIDNFSDEAIEFCRRALVKGL